MSVGTLEEIIDDNHAIVSTSVGSEHYVSILSFVDKDQLEPGCSVLLNHKVWPYSGTNFSFILNNNYYKQKWKNIHQQQFAMTFVDIWFSELWPLIIGTCSGGSFGRWHRSYGDCDEAREGSSGNVCRHWRTRSADSGNQGNAHHHCMYMCDSLIHVGTKTWKQYWIYVLI